jgi:hypothetical protein
MRGRADEALPRARPKHNVGPLRALGQQAEIGHGNELGGAGRDTRSTWKRGANQEQQCLTKATGCLTQTFCATMKGLACDCFSRLAGWQGQQDLNPRPSVLETDALPTELYP